MLLVEEQRSLIEKIVRNNKNFSGNEDLIEDFCSEAFEKSYLVFNSSYNIDKIESYISKVVHTSILSVLKNSGRVRRASSGFVRTKEVVLSAIKPKEEEKHTFGSEYILDFPDPKESPEEILITKDCLQHIADALCVIHSEDPTKCFYDIFYRRYVKGQKQNQIAQELNLSQGEISKRLMTLSKLISTQIDDRQS